VLTTQGGKKLGNLISDKWDDIYKDWA
jgi:hypothetical protein